MSPLTIVPHGTAHRFPHRRIALKVCRARELYPCQIETPPPPGHRAAIYPGERYVRVSIRPDKGVPDRWRTVRLCPRCAEHLGLATL